ncbi:MAG: hypothetical protein J6334_11325, partial [Kiritimatiellae bacterium]|nr:hypothetical protein [Kiritimatiellia bacterium]
TAKANCRVVLHKPRHRARRLWAKNVPKGTQKRKLKMKKLMFAAVAAAAGGLMVIESANVVG